jgi:hypothetical protein
MGIEVPRKKKEAALESAKQADVVQSAALQYGEEVFTGRTIDDAQAALEAVHPDFDDAQLEIQSGFVTEGGRFVNRKEAFDILMREGEMNRSVRSE